MVFSPLFRYESVALMSPRHRLAAKPWLEAADFADETLITYPVPDEMLDVMKHCLTPAGINPKRRTAELTVAILQLVASGRGIAALPSWTVGNYIERGYVVSRPIGAERAALRAVCGDHPRRRRGVVYKRVHRARPAAKASPNSRAYQQCREDWDADRHANVRVQWGPVDVWRRASGGAARRG